MHRDLKFDNFIIELKDDENFDEIYINKNYEKFTSKTKFTLKMLDFGLSRIID